ncbi:hypothetical protein DSOL_3277 [Desulfosporosinus metallidurans]|uniref:Uncharacterized protein n=1 Tax=Desulfosporosinus metallidurans TaxID=1888891 RepID=A0A1Q8QRG7_9FIRM|nr:hypothetical protein DSOL_3277 [Desulfosporosinus metallidurans]
MEIKSVFQPRKCLGDITLAEIKAEGFSSMGAFIDAWLDHFGYWDPQESLQPTSVRRIA